MVCVCVCDQKQEEQKPGAEPADMEGETLIAMVTKAVTAIIGRLQSELPHLCAWMNVCSFSFFASTFFAPKQRICLPWSQQGKQLQVQVKPVLSLSDCHCGTCSCQTFCPRSGAQCAIHCYVLCSLFNYVQGCVCLFMWMQNKCPIFKCVI